LSKNSFTGSLPEEVGNLESVSALDLSENNLTGEIPKTIEGCESLESLSLSGNSFQGTLPSTLASLRGLQYLDLSRNNFTGPIPKDLEKLTALLSLDLSFNDLDGEVPRTGVFQNISAISIAGNNKLCGGVPELQLPACPIKESKRRKINGRKLTITTVCVGVVLLLFSVLAIYYRRRIRKLSPTLSTIDFLSKVSYRSLYEATSGFSPSMLIGTGSFGSVYKGILGQEENPVAIKVLNLQQKGASKSFIAECNALRNIRHRNLVKILTCCSGMDYNGNEFKALIFQYMSNGSLERWLNPVTSNDETRSMSLSLTQRLNIVIDVASAVCYLHHHCDQPIVHCDLKPSNMLLDEEMIAHVSDFGIARLISDDIGSSEGQTSTIGIKGTIGYAPPEYAMGGEPSREGDVYSYGILILELFTGRRPTDEMFKDNFNLHNFVKMELPEKVVQVVDPTLLPQEVKETTSRRGREEERNRNKKCLVSILDIGIACSEDSPNERMNMEDVIMKLQRIRNAFIGE
ncbi:probable LRR receptor-like serine/threonine-protein kinase At3g47570, partial [Morus notabilis]|uniref:probable LRR receptor-like serine/threonine-protein kinase At3g47570 n=1 Tax=Morus notabilis TaxID=981085 RepID=UPI000CECF2A0